jgi:hypothetical protein
MNLKSLKMLLVLGSAIVLCGSTMAWGASAGASGDIGAVQKTSGSASVIRQGQTFPAQPGFKVRMNDILQTGPGGSMGVVFQDETALSLGPDSLLAIDEYVFAPKKGKFSIVLKMLKGTAVYFSGLISKLAPDAARFETPSASVGIRGTKFAVKVEDIR